MNLGKYVFSQILEFINRYEFDKCVERYSDNYRVHNLNCWNQFIQLFFGQLTSLNSLQNICLCLKAHERKLYHLGIKQHVAVSTLSRANENRDWRIFAEFGNYLVGLVRPLYSSSKIPRVDVDNEIFVLDSTSISVSINLCTWARGKYTRGAVKVHTLLNLRRAIPEFILVTDGKYHDSNALDMIQPQPGAIYLMDMAYVDFEALYRIDRNEAFFVTRAMSSQKYEVIGQDTDLDSASGLRADSTIVLTVPKSRKLYPDKLRLVDFYDDQNGELLVSLTNNFEVPALEVVNLYRNR